MLMRRPLWLIALPLLFVACSPGVAPEEAVPQAAVKEVPKYGGTLRLRVAGDPPNLDLRQNTTNQVVRYVALITDGLLAFDAWDPNAATVDDGAIVPALAERWEVSPDGKSYIFRLRREVQWHDGLPFTSADVALHLDQQINPKKYAGFRPVRGATLQAVKQILTPDDQTVVLQLDVPQASLLEHLASPWQGIHPKHIIEKDGDAKNSTIGTGPFKLKVHQKGISYEMARNQSYWKKDPDGNSLPYVDGVLFTIIPDETTTYAALISGQLDLSAIEPVQRKEIHKDRPELKLNTATFLALGGIHINHTRTPFQDIRVRRAMDLTIDRQAFLDTVYEGYGSNCGIFPCGSKWQLPEAELRARAEYQPDKGKAREEAKRLLAEAGYAAGFKTTLATRDSNATDALFLQGQLKLIGIEAEVDIKLQAAHQQALDNLAFDLVLQGQGVAVSDPDDVLGVGFTKDGGRNHSGTYIPEFDELFQRQSRELDFERRRDLVWQAQRLVMDRVIRTIQPLR
ncbi:MAG: ABC transporter substrate-binding protein, partial [Chloroflexi bacterium]|nr:ABC transporter substrate-binding protein [Chloroflexota bacterium]